MASAKLYPFVVRHSNGSVLSQHEDEASAKARAIVNNAFAIDNGYEARYEAGPAIASE